MLEVQRIGKQHYLVWESENPITEIQCVPPDSRRWYWRGSDMGWTDTLKQAIKNGIGLGRKGVRRNGKQLEAWSHQAQVAIEAKNPEPQGSN